MKPLSSNNYQVKQSDDDMQRHNAIRHHREGSGQDRYGQEAFRDEGVAVLYTIDGQKMQGDRRYYRLQSVKPYGPRDGQWVQMKEVRHVKTTPWGEKLFRFA